MKKIYSLFLLVATVSLLSLQTSYAQLRQLNAGMPKAASIQKGIIPNYSQMTIDTMFPPVFTMPCFTNDVHPYVF